MDLHKNINNYISLINVQNKRLINLLIVIIFGFLLIYTYDIKDIKDEETFQNHQDQLTIISAYYKIKSKRKPRQYKDFLHNFVMLNKSIVFFTNKRFMPRLKKMRPKELYNKTVFLQVEIEDFYSYKNFYEEFKKSFEIDREKRYHTISLYLIWAEKCNFLKKAIIKNFFNSTCFYWIDAGYFRDKSDIHTYSNNWPSTKKCYEDNRLLMGQVSNFSNSEIEKILNFDIQSHIRLQKYHNVIGGIFGGQKENLMKFIELYYKTLRLFIKNKIFIGKDQNIFTYISFAHPDVVKLIFCKNYTDYRNHIS